MVDARKGFHFFSHIPMTTAELNSDTILDQEVFNWMQGKYHPDNAVISGRSLKYILSKLPVILFLLEDADYESFHKSLLENGEPADDSLSVITSDKEIKFIARTSGKSFHFLYRPKSFLNANDTLQISTDFLTFDAAQNRWTGSIQELSDLQEGRIQILNKEEFTCREIFQICALHSMLDAYPDEEMLFQFMNFFHEEDYKLLSKNFLGKIFRKIVTGAKPSNAFLALDRIGALDLFLPELARGRGLSQNRYHKYDIFMHSVYTCDAVKEPDIILRLAGLFHDLGKVETRKLKSNGEASFHNHEMVSVKHADKIMKRFSFDSDSIKHVKFLVRNHMFHYTSEWSDKAIRRFMKKVGPDDMEDLLRLRLADRTGSGKKTVLPKAIKNLMKHIEEVRAREKEFKIKDLAINGHTLQDMGILPGPIMGTILQKLHGEVLEGKIPNDPAILRKTAEDLIQELS